MMSTSALLNKGWALCLEQPLPSLTLITAFSALVYCALLSFQHYCAKLVGDEHKIPTPRGLPIVGNLGSMLRKDYIQQVLAWCNVLGPVYRIR